MEDSARRPFRPWPVLLFLLLVAPNFCFGAEPQSSADDFSDLTIGEMPGGLSPQQANPSASVSAAERNGDIEVIVSRIVATDISPSALEAAQRTLEDMLGQAAPEVVHNLVQGQVYLFLIPKDKKLTDIPEFSSLRGQRTFDGRLWDDVRGEGYLKLSDGRAGVAVGEENLLGGSNEPASDHEYPALFVLAHEFSHAVQFAGLPKGLYDKSVQIYQEEMDRQEDTGLGQYADSNAYENFAQAAAAYFGVGYLDIVPNQHKLEGAAARQQLLEKQQPMYELLSQIYGLVRDLWPPTPSED